MKTARMMTLREKTNYKAEILGHIVEYQRYYDKGIAIGNSAMVKQALVFLKFWKAEYQNFK